MSAYPDNYLDFLDFRCNIIYLLILREHAEAGLRVYKVGRTDQLDFVRFKQGDDYKKGVKVLYINVCANCVTAEREILSIFKKKYGSAYFKDEYFEGNLETMKDIIHNVIRKQNRELVDDRTLYSNPPRPRVIINSYNKYLEYSNITDLIITNKVSFAGYMKLRNEPFYQTLRYSATTSNTITAQLTYLINIYKTQIQPDEPKREFDDAAIVADIIKTRFRADTMPHQLEYDEYIIKLLPDITLARSSDRPADIILFAKLISNPRTFIDCCKSDKLLLQPQSFLVTSARYDLTIFHEIINSYFTTLDDIDAFYKLCCYVFIAPIASEPMTLNDRLYPIKPYIYDEGYYEHIDYCPTDWIYNCMNMLYPSISASPVIYSRDYLEGMPTPRMVIIEAPDNAINSEVIRFIERGIKHIVVRRRIAPNSAIYYNNTGRQYNAPKATMNYRAANLNHYLMCNRARIEAYLYKYNGENAGLQDILAAFNSEGIAALFHFGKYFYNEMLAYIMK
jgi:hypothetical protein